MDAKRQMIDQSAIRFNQGSIVVLTLVGFITNVAAFPAFVAAVLLAGSFTRSLALFKLTYQHVAKPLGLVRPDPVEDSPAPHEFAQLLGGVVLAAGSVLLFIDSALLGWALAWVVVLLAAVNLVFGFCTGCFLYYQLGRLGIRGFQPRSS